MSEKEVQMRKNLMKTSKRNDLRARSRKLKVRKDGNWFGPGGGKRLKEGGM